MPPKPKKSGEILPCKKHGIMPSWVEVERSAYSNMSGLMWPMKPQRKLECFKCKAEEEEARNFPEINAWNEKQQPAKRGRK